MGFDSALELSSPDGATTTFPALITEGILVYSVDSSVGTGEVPIKLPGDPGTGTVDDYPILTVGDSVTVSGYTITVVSDDGETHTVSIVKTSDG